MRNRSAVRTLFFVILIAVVFTLTMPLRNSAQTTLTSVPAGSAIVVSVSAQPPASGVTLSYRWRVTDGTVVDVNAPVTTWTLSAGQGLHSLYVQVSNGQGGYTVKRLIVATTDVLATAPAVVSTAPRPTIPAIPPSAAPLGAYRGWLPDQRPDIALEAVSSTTGKVFGPVATDVQGSYVFFNMPVDNYQLNLSDAPGRSFRPSNSSYVYIGDDSSYTEYGAFLGGLSDAPSYLDQIGNTVVAGHVALQDGSLCGTVDKFFGAEVTATATLVNTANAVVAGPVRVNSLGFYQLDASLPSSGNYSVRVACEALPVQTAVVSIGVTEGSTNVYRSVDFTLLSAAPVVSGLSATLLGVPIQSPGAASGPLPSDNYPEASRFMSTKGIDSRMSACQYYLAAGAVQSCDSSGNPSGGITFDVWKQRSGLSPYNSGGELQATYINQVDLNLTRNHHGVQNGSNVAMYVCNYAGPSDDTVQAQVDTAISNAVNNKTLLACVAMDYTSTMGVNGGAPFTRFLTFGPSGNLLLSVNLDGRGEKFLPGSCAPCHAGDHYAGHFPTDGSGVANIGAHFIPFDTGNFVFSSQSSLSLSSQAAAIKGLNQLVLKTNPTPSMQNLINAWYASGSSLQDNSYIPTAWSDPTLPTDQAMYSTVIKHSCRTCHIAQPNDQQAGNSFDLDADNDHHSTIGQSVCGGTLALWANHTMPDSKVTFDRMWKSQGGANDQIAAINAWYQAYDPTIPVCALSTPDPVGVPFLFNNATSFPNPAWLNITNTHIGDFRPGQTGATYNVAVSNLGAAKTSGVVTVAETVPSGLTFVSMAGTGWSCPVGGTTCTRSDSLTVGASYAPITVTVNVAANPASPVTNQVTVSGGGSANASANDVTLISALGRCDVKQNGSINVAALQFLIDEALGVIPAVNDLNGDHVVNAVDVQLEANAALGLGCKAQ